jgi:hypothetical protein
MSFWEFLRLVLGKRFFHAAGEDEASVEGFLLEALKVVT